MSWQASWLGWRGFVQRLTGHGEALGQALSFPWGTPPPEPTLLRWNEQSPADGPMAAEARARTLLLRMLAPAQREELERRDCFTVSVPGRGRFAILPRRTLNVLNLDSGECYCCITATEVPLWDLMLAQKLMLENDPDQFFAVANCPSEFLFGPIGRVGTARRRRASPRPAPRIHW
jgi:hypothetical protein